METQDLEQESEFVKKIRSLDKEIELGRRNDKFEEVEYTVGELMEMYIGTYSIEKLTLYANHEYEVKEKIIDKETKTTIIEKLLIGVPITPISVIIRNNEIEVRNGGVELAIVFSFFGCLGKKWSLDGLYLPSAKGMFVDDLPLRMQSKIKSAGIRCHVMRIE